MSNIDSVHTTLKEFLGTSPYKLFTESLYFPDRFHKYWVQVSVESEGTPVGPFSCTGETYEAALDDVLKVLEQSIKSDIDYRSSVDTTIEQFIDVVKTNSSHKDIGETYRVFSEEDLYFAMVEGLTNMYHGDDFSENMCIILEMLVAVIERKKSNDE